MKIRNIISRAWFRAHGVRWSGSSPVFGGFIPPCIHIGKGGSITLGSHFCCGSGVVLSALGDARIEIGSGVHMNDRSSIVAASLVMIKNGVKIAPEVAIMDTNFHATAPGRDCSARAVVIMDNVWIASRAMVLRGVTIGAHSIVSAGSVASRNVPPYSIAVGNPAAVVSTFQCPADWRRA